MSNNVDTFGKTAANLARNPLGIIALFIVLVYGFACLLTASSSFSEQDRTALVFFIIGFPILVLFIFTWLVVFHSNKLFAPSDFRDEENYLRAQQITAAASLVLATSKIEDFDSARRIEGIVEAVQRVAPLEEKHASWRNQILWVDDMPQNNIYVQRAFEAYGLEFTQALSTTEALQKLKLQKFAAIISDMGRAEGPREGYTLLDALRKSNDQTPLFFYASSNAPEHKIETAQHGGQGCTNDAEELFVMVTKAVIQRA